jgi:tRNA threonylcarbamoyladenosine biosynthesis protein TsaB
MTERLVVALDGSTRVCSAALLRAAGGLVLPGQASVSGWEIMAQRAETDGRGQAKVLLRLVEEMLTEADAGPDSLGSVVVGTGPGTFTGVRIAVATARALGLALNIPVLGVSTLGALAAAGACALAEAEPTGPDAGDTLVPVVDARRGQVFFAVYERNRAADHLGPAWARSGEVGVCDRAALTEVLGCRAGSRMAVVAEEALVEGLAPGVALLTRDVAAEHLLCGQQKLVEPGGLPQGERLELWLRLVLAAQEVGSGAWVGSSLWSPDEPGEVGTPESVKPIYVRSPDADLHITKMKDPWGDGPTGV